MPKIPCHSRESSDWGVEINPYSLVIIAEVYSKQSKVLFCSANNPKGKNSDERSLIFRHLLALN